VIKIESTTETIESKGGLLLAGKIAKKTGLGRIKSALVNQAGAVIEKGMVIFVHRNVLKY